MRARSATWALASLMLTACGDSGTGSGGAGAGGTGASSSSSGASTSVACAAASTGTGTGGAGGYVAGQDSSWTKACWMTACEVQFADEPQKAVPPLSWESCGQGCERLVKDWPAENTPGLSEPRVMRTATGYRLGLIEVWIGHARAAVFDEAGLPMAVWRSPPGPDTCLPSIPSPTPTGVWVGTWAFGTSYRYVFEPWNTLGTASVALDVPFSSESSIGTDSLLALRGDFANSAAIYDRTSGQLSVLGPPAVLGAALPQPRDDKAFVLGNWAFNRTEGWAWTRAGGFVKLLDVQPKDVIDLKSDGQTLAWIESPPRNPPDDDVWPAGTLYKSPEATSPAALVPVPVRSMLAVTPDPPSAIGGGYYAAYAGYDDVIQIVRLSDGYGWTLTPGEPQSVFTISYIDDQVMYYRTAYEVFRITLAQLGPPSPP